MMIVKLSPKTVLKVLSQVVLVLLVADLIGIFISLIPGHEVMSSLIHLFDFNSENNIPTLYSSLNLMLTAVLLYWIAMQHKLAGADWLSWLGLAIVLGFLSIDETASIHEQLAVSIQQLLSLSEVLSFVWVIPYLFASGILGVLYFEFLTRLPRRTLSLFLLSGTIFILGAAGLEFGGHWLAQAHGKSSLLFKLFYTFEELLEMFGVIIFIYALLDYMATQFGFLKVEVTDQILNAHRQRRNRLF